MRIWCGRAFRLAFVVSLLLTWSIPRAAASRDGSEAGGSGYGHAAGDTSAQTGTETTYVWTRLASLETPGAPPPRFRRTVTWDTVNNRLLVFGGYSEGVYHNDLWEFSEANGWRELERTRPLGNPVPRSGHGAVWDAQANAMLLFGGVGPTGMRNDLVQYGSGGSWLGLSEQAVPGAPGTACS
ncbi:MAG: hypothetical protein HY329_13605, partial [Chloroflexi bacterium]|nr:hypothetical protein [Chloroflexota bacterium]